MMHIRFPKQRIKPPSDLCGELGTPGKPYPSQCQGQCVLQYSMFIFSINVFVFFWSWNRQRALNNNCCFKFPEAFEIIQIRSEIEFMGKIQIVERWKRFRVGRTLTILQHKNTDKYGMRTTSYSRSKWAITYDFENVNQKFEKLSWCFINYLRSNEF